ncbi:ATP-dependent Clp protease adaptor ClpS, partial [Verminephrobacter sp. Larva24]
MNFMATRAPTLPPATRPAPDDG